MGSITSKQKILRREQEQGHAHGKEKKSADSVHLSSSIYLVYVHSTGLQESDFEEMSISLPLSSEEAQGEVGQDEGIDASVDRRSFEFSSRSTRPHSLEEEERDRKNTKRKKRVLHWSSPSSGSFGSTSP